MTQKPQGEQQLLKDIEIVRQSLTECDTFMRESKALTVSMGIDLITLEINCLMKKMFLANLHELGSEQYIWLGKELLNKMTIIHTAVENRFGELKKTPPEPAKDGVLNG